MIQDHASLFTGIGGFDLAASWMGWRNIFQVENDAFCIKNLEKNFPGVMKYGNIREFSGKPYRNRIDILTGGFPCQPFSISGKRSGRSDDRHLWPEMLRVIQEIYPPYIVCENVFGLISVESGLVLHEILSDLENCGYETGRFIIPACAVDAPHRRDRVWIIAHACNAETSRLREHGGEILQKPKSERPNVSYAAWTASDSNSINENLPGFHSGEVSFKKTTHIQPDFRQFPSQSPVCGKHDGISNRLDRLRALGNAIVPQLALKLFSLINEYDKEKSDG